MKKNCAAEAIFGSNVFIFAVMIHAAGQQSCPPPDVPVPGSYVPKQNRFLPGDRVAYTCKEGFTLLGKEIRTCKSNGAWSDVTPFCDSPARLKNPRVTSSFSPTLYRVIDGDSNTCFSWEKSTGHGLLLYLDDKVVVHAVRIFLNRGSTKIQIFTGLDNNMKLCADYDRFLEASQWVLIKCRSTDVIADSIKLSNTADKNSNITICEVEVYVKDEFGCEHPPEIGIPHGYFEISRNKATLFCEAGYKSENSRIVCEGNSWKGPGPRCEELLCDPVLYNVTVTPGSEWVFVDAVRKVSAGTRRKLRCGPDQRPVGGPETVTCLNTGFWSKTNATCVAVEKSKTSTKMIIIGVATIVVLIIIALLVITICIIRKQRAKEVVVVYKPSMDGSMNPVAESEYAAPYYETIHSSNVPSLPMTPRPAPIAPVLHEAYILPEDAKGTYKKNKTMPADIAFGTLKQSALYGN